MSRSGPVGIGIVSAGVISDTYLENLAAFADTEVLAIGDLRPEAARAKAAKHGIAVAGDVDVVLADLNVEIVVNLTIPAAHAEVSGRALAAGKHVWSEEPLALDRAGGRASRGAFVPVESAVAVAPLLPDDWDARRATV